MQNYFKKNHQPLELINGNSVSNFRTREVNRLIMPDGHFKEFVIVDTVSVPDGHGGYVDGKIHNTYINDAGHPMPADMHSRPISTTGQIIPSQEFEGFCTSSFHPKNMPRNVYIGYDGTTTNNGAICSICRRRRNFFRLMILLPIVGWAVGIVCFIIWS